MNAMKDFGHRNKYTKNNRDRNTGVKGGLQRMSAKLDEVMADAQRQIEENRQKRRG